MDDRTPPVGTPEQHPAHDPDPGPDAGPGPEPAEPAQPAQPSDQGRGTPVGRRLVLGMLGLGAVGVGVGGAVQDRLDSVLASVSAKDPTGVTGLLPGGGGFRFYSVSDSIPHRGETDYRLTVDGLVDHRADYRLADLRALPQTRLVRDVQCVTGWRVPKTAFSGVLLSTLLETAGVRSGAAAVRFSCFDGVYTESLTLDQARRADVLVALTMNDKPVTAAHGGPVRLYVAPMYFYKSAKWLSGITVTKDVRPGYWEHYGYDVDGWVGKSNGRHDDPTS
ncbi:molybdopterin-dependent oxidoreductase [Actinacidiphila epipremni]|uniref:Molybdopterin-dependent oxidoreductase n=1 Tax=Actinacidiphila epipremni TaxID=2053013 RepID=A0ABX0ZJ32_9ACTN|nr:molybdopterin-dependent oxidoreductase [Actinacidiphila epipremni]